MALSDLGSPGKFATNFQTGAAPAKADPKRVLRALPPTSQWANARSFGAMGDGKADDTAALQKAIDSNRVVYLPLGFYVVNDTIRLKPDTVLVGLHPASLSWCCRTARQNTRASTARKPCWKARKAATQS